MIFTGVTGQFLKNGLQKFGVLIYRPDCGQEEYDDWFNLYGDKGDKITTEDLQNEIEELLEIVEEESNTIVFIGIGGGVILVIVVVILCIMCRKKEDNSIQTVEKEVKTSRIGDINNANSRNQIKPVFGSDNSASNLHMTTEDNLDPSKILASESNKKMVENSKGQLELV